RPTGARSCSTWSTRTRTSSSLSRSVGDADGLVAAQAHLAEEERAVVARGDAVAREDGPSIAAIRPGEEHHIELAEELRARARSGEPDGRRNGDDAPSRPALGRVDGQPDGGTAGHALGPRAFFTRSGGSPERVVVRPRMGKRLQIARLPAAH